MKKNIITGIILAMATATTAQVYASPINISGSSKTEYELTEQHEYKSKSEVKVYMNTHPDEKTKIELDFKYKNSNNNTANSETNAITLYNVYVENKLNKDLSMRLGSQPIDFGKGLWMAADGVGGAGLFYQLDKSNRFKMFAGRDSQEDTVKDPVTKKVSNKTYEVQYFAWDNSFDKGSVGAYLGKEDFNKYLGMHGEYEFAHNAKISGEYVKNNHNSTSAYVVELAYGETKKIGDFKYVASYLNADPRIFNTADYTEYDDNYDEATGFKGVGASISYKISKAATVSIEKWWGENKSDGATWINSQIKMSCKF